MPASIRCDADRRGSLRRSATLCAAILLLSGSAFAAEPAEGRGAAMLDALRDRDPAAHWDAAGTALPPSGAAAVEPSLARPTAADDAEWFPEAASQQIAAPARFAQREPLVPYEPLPEADDDAAPAISPLPDPVDSEDPSDFQPIARTPEDLRKIGEILPFHDYSPDPGDDPCLYLCPRPDGLPCKENGSDKAEPPCPVELGLGNKPFVPRSMPPSVFAWKASNVSHNPLYFEDPQLERYGHTYGDCIQPFVSLGRFGVQVVGLPYQMALDPPCKEVYPLGYYRPGEPAPKLHHQVPLNARAAALAAVFYTGVGVILP